MFKTFAKLPISVQTPLTRFGYNFKVFLFLAVFLSGNFASFKVKFAYSQTCVVFVCCLTTAKYAQHLTPY